MNLKGESGEKVVEESLKKVVNKDNCGTCEKRLGIRGFKCKCEIYFCKKHRLPENHECGFDHR